MRYSVIILALFTIAVSACDRASLMKTMTPSKDEHAASAYITLLRERRFEPIEKALDPSVKRANLNAALTKMAALFPSGKPLSVKVVGSHVLQSAQLHKSSITFEYQFPGKWLLANVAIQRKGDTSTLIGLTVHRIPDSLENLTRFTLSGKSSLHYAVLSLAVLIPLFIVSVLVLCVRTRVRRRKWLWIIFILLGIGRFAINWTSGQWAVTPLSIELLGAGATAAPYGPWTLYVSIPLGAILFLLMRPRLREAPV